MFQKTFAAALIVAFAAAAQVPTPGDVVTIGTVSGAAGTSVDVPVYIRDISGTPLGLDQPPGSRIQSYALTVGYSPAASVSAVTFTRSGIAATLTPAFESTPTSAGSISLLDTFQESTNLIPFLVNAPAPGNQIAVLHVTLSPSAPTGSVTLTLNPALTQLANQGGTTTETTTNLNLVLVNGSITVAAAPQAVPVVSSVALVLLVLSLGGGGWLLQQRS